MKAKLGDLIHYERDGRPHSARVLSLLHIQNAHDGWASTPEQKEAFQQFGPARTAYATCHGVVEESDVTRVEAMREEAPGTLSGNFTVHLSDQPGVRIPIIERDGDAFLAVYADDGTNAQLVADALNDRALAHGLNARQHDGRPLAVHIREGLDLNEKATWIDVCYAAHKTRGGFKSMLACAQRRGEARAVARAVVEAVKPIEPSIRALVERAEGFNGKPWSDDFVVEETDYRNTFEVTAGQWRALSKALSDFHAHPSARLPVVEKVTPSKPSDSGIVFHVWMLVHGKDDYEREHEEPSVITYEELLADNPDEDEFLAKVRGLAVGETYVHGGGASVAVEYQRVAAPELSLEG